MTICFKSNRLFRAASVLICLLLLGFAPGCGPSESRVEIGNREGILHINNGTEIQSLDPHTTSGLPESHVIGTLLEGLTAVDPETLEAIPAAARAWEISDDGMVYTFFLREDGAWSNGDPVTADDFVFSLERILSPNLAAAYYYMPFPITGARDFYEGRHEDFSEVGVRALDDLTLEIRLDYPLPYFLTLLAHNSWYPVHPDTILRHGAMDEPNTRWVRPENFVGNGPFTLHRWATGRRIEVRRNTEYWDAGRIHLNEIHFYPLQPLSGERAFRAGQLHITDPVPSERIAYYRDERPEVFGTGDEFGTYYLRLNVTHPPFDDPRVRLALSLALDRETLVDNIYSGERPAAYSFVPPGVPDYDPEPVVTHDVRRARELLAEAGFPGGEGFPSVRILYNTSDEHSGIAQLVQEMWRRELGLNIGLENTEWQVYLDRMNRLDYQIARSGWIGDYLDPFNFLNTMVTAGGNNRTGWSNAEYDMLLEEIQRTADVDARRELIRDAETLLVQEAPVLPLFFYSRLYLIHPAVRNWRPTPTGYRFYKDVALSTED